MMLLMFPYGSKYLLKRYFFCPQIVRFPCIAFAADPWIHRGLLDFKKLWRMKSENVQSPGDAKELKLGRSTWTLIFPASTKDTGNSDAVRHPQQMTQYDIYTGLKWQNGEHNQSPNHRRLKRFLTLKGLILVSTMWQLRGKLGAKSEANFCSISKLMIQLSDDFIPSNRKVNYSELTIFLNDDLHPRKTISWNLGTVPALFPWVSYLGHWGEISPRNKWVLYHDWLVVSTHLENISQNGNLPQVGMKIKHI